MSTNALDQASALDLDLEVSQLRERIQRLQTENARLRNENRGLRCSLDTLVARVRSTAHFGPLEFSTGTSVGPGGPWSDDGRAAHRRPA